MNQTLSQTTGTCRHSTGKRARLDSTSCIKGALTRWCNSPLFRFCMHWFVINTTLYYTKFQCFRVCSIALHLVRSVPRSNQQTSETCSRGHFKQKRSYKPRVDSTRLSSYARITVFPEYMLPAKRQPPTTIPYSIVLNLHVHTFKSTVQSG
jgi:hypothetical protein